MHDYWADKAISTFVVNDENLTRSLSRNPILVTALNPIIGYAKAAEIAKLAYKQKRPVIDVAQELTIYPNKSLRLYSIRVNLHNLDKQFNSLQFDE